AARQKMTTVTLLHQPALLHVDARGQRHPVVGVLDQAVTHRILQFLVTVAGDTIELQQPVGEAFTGLYLTRAYFAGLRVPGDHRLGTRATGGSAHAQDVLERIAHRMEGEGT